MSKAGVNVRQLALRRRKKARSRFVGALSSFAVPLLALLILPTSPGLVTLILIASLTSALMLYKQGKEKELWGLANRADRGARGEENVARLLKSLKRQGWKMEYNISLTPGEMLMYS